MFLNHKQIDLYTYYTKYINNVWLSDVDILQDVYTYLEPQLLLMAVQQDQPGRYIYIRFSKKQIMVYVNYSKSRDPFRV